MDRGMADFVGDQLTAITLRSGGLACDRAALLVKERPGALQGRVAGREPHELKLKTLNRACRERKRLKRIGSRRDDLVMELRSGLSDCFKGFHREPVRD